MQEVHKQALGYIQTRERMRGKLHPNAKPQDFRFRRLNVESTCLAADCQGELAVKLALILLQQEAVIAAAVTGQPRVTSEPGLQKEWVAPQQTGSQIQRALCSLTSCPIPSSKGSAQALDRMG